MRNNRCEVFGNSCETIKFLVILRNNRCEIIGNSIMKLSSPFITTGYISPEYFCDRYTETEQLKNAVLNSTNTSLFSFRKLGKTALIRHVIYLLKKEGTKCIYLDIMETKCIQDFTYKFAKAYFNQASNISDKVLSHAGKLLRAFVPSLNVDSITGNLSLDLKLMNNDNIQTDLENIFENIKNSNDKYFIAIDEFQQIVDYPEKNFEAFLRSKLQFINNANFVFSGSKKHMLLSIFGDYNRPFWNSCRFLELKPINREKYYEFIIEKFSEHNRSIDLESLNYIYNSCRGITFYIQLICNNLYNRNISRINIKDAYEALDNIIGEHLSYFINLSDILTDRQFQLLKALALENGFEQPTSGDFITKHKLGSTSTVKSALDNLINKEMIYKDDDTYFVADVLFSEWLKKK